MKRVTILGATGSVGQNTIDLIRRASEGYEVIALTGGRNIARLASDARALRAQVAVTAYEELLPDLRAALDGSGIAAAAGAAAIAEAAARPADWVMSAIVGAAGLAPGLAALKQGGVLALANKESLVTAGPLLMRVAREHGARILPVDSEHSAVFQALNGESLPSIRRVTLTASGGAFRDWPLERLAKASVAEASCHPNWNMGQRITIDSASMFNKALEVIEAKEYFGLKPEQVAVLVHPQSIIHAMVEFCDGGTLAHMGVPDMRHAIGYALHWPERQPLPLPALDLAQIGQLDFSLPDPARYPALGLARLVMERGGLSGAVFNAAKERALDHFIDGRIGFTDMNSMVERVLNEFLPQDDLIGAEMDLDTVHRADLLARQAIDRAAQLQQA